MNLGENMKLRVLTVVAVSLLGLSLVALVLLLSSRDSTSAFGIGGKTVVWLGPNSGVDVGDVTVNNTSPIPITASTSLPISIDSVVITVTDALPIHDDGGSITVDGTVAVSDITTGTIVVSNVTTGTISVDGSVTADTELAAATATGDGATNPTVPQVGAVNSLYNDSTWDRERGNWSEWPFPSAVRTYVHPIVGEYEILTNYNARGAYIFVSITGVGTDQTLTVYGKIYDSGEGASGQMETIWTSAALTEAGRSTYLIYPGAGAASQDVVATVSYPLPRKWVVGVTVTNSEPITFSVGVHYIN